MGHRRTRRRQKLAIAAIRRDGYRYKKGGVMLTNLVKADTVGSALFAPPEDARTPAA